MMSRIRRSFEARRVERMRDAREASALIVLSHDLRAPLLAMRNLALVIDERWDELTEGDRRRSVRAVADQASGLLEQVSEMIAQVDERGRRSGNGIRRA